MIFKRKIYDELLRWKRTDEGRTAVLITGRKTCREVHRCRGICDKTNMTLIYWWILPHAPLKSATCSMMYLTLTLFSCGLQLEYGTELKERKSAIIFDEVQLAPKARQGNKVSCKRRKI